jgi:hypothetical protein
MTGTLNRRDQDMLNSQQPIQIDLASPAGSRKRLDDPLQLVVTITNVSAAPVWMIGVLPGSEGLRYPKYTAEIEGPAGRAPAQFPEALDYVPAPRVEQFVKLDPGESFDPQGKGFVPVQQFAWFRPTQPGTYRFRLGLDTTASDLRDWLGHTSVTEPGRVAAMIQQVPRVKVWSNTLVITFGSGA